MASPVYAEETFNYEILLRFGDTGDNKGKLIGAHLVTITQTTKNGAVIASSIDSPQQLALVDGDTGRALADVLGDVSSTVIIENQILTQRATAAEASLSQLTDERLAQDERIRQLQAQLEKAQVEASARETRIAHLELAAASTVAQEEQPEA